MEMKNKEIPTLNKFEWQDEFNTGAKKIDSQHKELFTRIDDLALAIYNGSARSQLNTLIVFLENYVEEHFSYEESLMKKNGFPHIEEHMEKHSQFIGYFSSVVQEIGSKGIDVYLAIKVEKEVRKWWEDHILGDDMEYVPYLKKV